MVADEALCAACGTPLLGRDRFEGKCAACREREILGEPPGPGREVAAASPAACPACGASVPPGRAACAECGARLGGRRAASRVVAGALVVVAVAIVAAVGFRAALRAVLSPRVVGRLDPPVQPVQAVVEPESPTRSPAVGARRQAEDPAAPRPATPLALVARQETEELLGLLAARDYGRVIVNYCCSDEAELARLQGLLDDLLHGKGAAGLSRWSALLRQLGERATAERLGQAGDPHPDYTVALLTHLASDRGAPEPIRRLLGWHLAGVFEGMGLAHAKVGRIEERGPEQFVVHVECGGTAAAPRPGDAPRTVRWRKLPAGWSLLLALGDRLEEARTALGRAIPNPGPATP